MKNGSITLQPEIALYGANHDRGSLHFNLINPKTGNRIKMIAQDAETKAVLMVAWMNAETLKATLEGGRMVYWSRSRQEVWRKGDTSGDRQCVREAYYDCDADVLLFMVEQ